MKYPLARRCKYISRKLVWMWSPFLQQIMYNMKKALRETQTLRAGCSKVEPKIFTPPQTPFPGAQDGQNLISWRWSLPLPTNPVWWRLMHAISSYRGNRPTNKQTHRQDRLQYTAPQLAHSVTTRAIKLLILSNSSICCNPMCKHWKPHYNQYYCDKTSSVSFNFL